MKNINLGKMIAVFLILMAIVWIIGKYQLVKADADPTEAPTKMRVTCYVGDGTTANGQQTRPHIMAAKQEWLGYVACVNAVNEDGSIGEFIGFFEITDTGYGAETGVGESKILKGKTLGTIEAGKTVDIWMPTTHQAEEWIDTYGDYLYIKLIKGNG